MKRYKKIVSGLVCAVIVLFGLNSATLIASAASYDAPQTREELLAQEIEMQRAGMSDKVTVLCKGYIIPLAAETPDTPSIPDSPDTPVIKAPVPAGTPKTGDDSNIGWFAVIGLSSLLVLLLLLEKREKKDEPEIQGS